MAIPPPSPSGEAWIPDRFARQEQEQKESAAAIRNAFHTTARTLRATVAALPVTRAASIQTSGWTISDDAIIGSASIPWESGKTVCHVSVSIDVSYDSAPLTSAYTPRIHIWINGVDKGRLPLIFSRGSGYCTVGTRSDELTVSASVDVEIRAETFGQTPAASPDNTANAAILAIFSS